ncbi:MAG TPA: tRNA (adenosine(37)-N6)-dimethylallyltransferase MiaA [Patescibacteria group bacterium]|nr:tRNA (adenosine(37)-N6)-dimethylallyltransferase MiaA [Patescibacteria group bacterium]
MNSEINKKPKLIVLLGPTACGKTSWSLRLAKKFNGDIISADSRQVYKDMNIGTAKEPGEWLRIGLRKTFFVQDIPHHLIDFLDPGKQFTISEFRDKALKYVKLAVKNRRQPFVVGGTGLYISALVDNFKIPKIPANKKLRNSLSEKSIDELFELLTLIDPESAKKIDKKNKRRVIRALEVSILSGEPFSKQKIKGEQLFNCLKIGIETDREVLYKRIDERVDQMIKDGLEQEVKKLVDKKYIWELPSMSGIGYRQFKDYFDGKISLKQVVENLKKETRRYAKRQLTWFRRDKDIKWCKTYEEAEELVCRFLECK